MSIAAQQNLDVPPPGLSMVAYQQLTGVTGLQALPAQPVDHNSVYVIVSVEGGNVRWRADGTSPSASVGSPLYATARQPFTKDVFETLKFFPTDSATVSINLEWYGK